MTAVLITCDTELSPRLFQQGADARANFVSSILGRTDRGDFGIGWQMQTLADHGLTGVFFVDPMPALVYGPEVVADIVACVRDAGHEVQLHLHSEWLRWADPCRIANLGAGPIHDNLGSYDQDRQRAIITLARDLLVAAGAPPPTAFRAGNFAANDDTLRAASACGIRWDTSFNPAFAPNPCAIALPGNLQAPVRHCGLVEMPVAGVTDLGGHCRPAQVCALSRDEMARALDHTATGDAPFVIVTHSFERLSRDRKRPNRIVMRRYAEMCDVISRHETLTAVTFADLDPVDMRDRVADQPQRALYQVSGRQWAGRITEQALGRVIYERRLSSPPARLDQF